jgi:hypothetical protein
MELLNNLIKNKKLYKLRSNIFKIKLRLLNFKIFKVINYVIKH